MNILRHTAPFERLGEETMAAWRRLPTAIVGDSLDRTGCMASAIKCVWPGARLFGQARTVVTMVGDNSTIHAAVELAEPGDVLVVDAGGACEVAIWGGVITEAATLRGVAGVVIDGAIRDVEELRGRRFPVFARAVTPRGPHKGHGGTIDGPAAVGGVSISPGDLVIGDDDGVVIVPLARHREILEKALQRSEMERGWIEQVRLGRSTREILGLPAAVVA